MNILLTGATGGIGSAIKEHLKQHTFVDYAPEIDWIIFAHGVIDEQNTIQTFNVNTICCISLTQQHLSRLKQGVIYISSTSGIHGNTKFPIYSASKAALNSYAQTMARKYHELKFYALCPGPTDTKMWRGLGLEGTAQSPHEVAKAVERIMNGEFESGSIITVRDGKVSV